MIVNPWLKGDDCPDYSGSQATANIEHIPRSRGQLEPHVLKFVRQQNLPVTINYPEMVAEIFPHFEGNEIPDFGKDNLWFL